jgi:glycosyltransferase involved in cell wall biosynthesis
MRLCFILPAFHSNLEGWLVGLQEAGHNVTIEAVRPLRKKTGASMERTGAHVNRIPESGVSAWVRRLPGLRDGGRRWFLPPPRRYCRYLVSLKADALIVRPQSLPVLMIARAASRRAGIPLLVYEQHDPRPLRAWWPPRQPVGFRAGAIYGTLRLRFLARFLGDGMLSPVLNTDLADGPVPASFVPFAAPRDSTFAPSSGQEGALRVLMIARFIQRKRHDLALRAIESLRDAGHDVTLTILGHAYGDEECTVRNHIIDLVGRSPHAAAVRVLTNLSEVTAVQRCYQEADVLLLPSEKEPASVAVAEAMANSLPVLVNTTCGTASYVLHGVTGFHLEEGSLPSIVEAIESLLNDPDQHQAMRVAAHARASDWMTPAATAARILGAVAASRG